MSIAPLNSTEIADVCAEVAATAIGLPVQRVVQPDEHTVVLDLRGRGLLLSTAPRAGRLHLLRGKPSGTGEQPPAFCMLLRKYLEGARLTAITAIAGERAVELGFERADGERALRLFLFGRASQLQLIVDARVLGHIGPAQQVYAELPPPRVLDATPTSRFVSTAPSPEIEALFTEGLLAVDDEARRREALQRLGTEAKRLRRLHDALVKDLDRMIEVPRLRKEADLLLALASHQPSGHATIELEDLVDGGPPLTITLDPSLSAVDNAQRRYKHSRRLERGRLALSARVDTVAAELARVEADLQRIADGGDVTTPLPQPKPQRGPQSAGRAPQKRAPYRAFRSQRGVPILVGRGAEKNDELTFKVARGNDWWMHTRDAAGAHVVVVTDGRPIDEATLLDAATLAVHFSSLRDEAQVDVSYTQRKSVKKPPKSKPGLVSVAGAKTIRVRMEADRLTRLLATLQDDA